jgi:hypothetical protein
LSAKASLGLQISLIKSPLLTSTFTPDDLIKMRTQQFQDEVFGGVHSFEDMHQEFAEPDHLLT